MTADSDPRIWVEESIFKVGDRVMFPAFDEKSFNVPQGSSVYGTLFCAEPEQFTWLIRTDQGVSSKYFSIKEGSSQGGFELCE